MSRTPDGPPPLPTVQRLRLRYAKRGRLRFASSRDFQRALERALRRSDVPIAYSAGFTPHPKVSYAGAAPTGAASEAEYLELGLTRRLDPAAVRRALDAALPDGLDVVDAVEAAGGTLAERLEGSVWEVTLPGVDEQTARAAVTAFIATARVEVDRRTKNGLRTFDARAAVVRLEVRGENPAPVIGHTSRPTSEPGAAPCAILRMVVRHQVLAVRPDDVLSGLRAVASLEPPVPPAVTRLAQGPLDESTGSVLDPLAPDRDSVGAGTLPSALP